ncbi:MAG: septum formation inhibitor [Bacteroidales bacterium]|nr:septum formation inhibitor [Bacteroidales bacterium]
MSLKEHWLHFKGSRFIKLIRNKFVIALFLFVLWVAFFDANNLVKWSKIVINISEQESQKRYYKEAINSIDEKLNELSSNRDSLEKFAREQYLFKEDDEDIFIVEEPK